MDVPKRFDTNKAIKSGPPVEAVAAVVVEAIPEAQDVCHRQTAAQVQ